MNRATSRLQESACQARAVTAGSTSRTGTKAGPDRANAGATQAAASPTHLPRHRQLDELVERTRGLPEPGRWAGAVIGSQPEVDAELVVGLRRSIRSPSAAKVGDGERAKSFWTETMGFDLIGDPMGDGARWIEVAPPEGKTRLVLFTPEGQQDRIGTFSNVLFECDVLRAGDGRYAGDLVRKRRGEWHTFWNAGDEPARMLELISPAGFERYFAAQADALESGTPPDPDFMAALLERHGLVLPGAEGQKPRPA